jgi:PAS domain S-box-containing protein
LKRHILLVLTCLFCWLHLPAQLYTFKNFDHRDGLSLSDITAIAQTDDGFLYLGTDGAGILKFNGNKFSEISFPHLDNDHHVSGIVVSPTQEIYFSSRFKGLFKLTTKGYIHLHKNNDTDGESIGLHFVKDLIFSINKKSIIVQQKGQELERFLFSDENEIDTIASFIDIPQGTILLTNKGGYVLTNGKQKITPLNEWLKQPKSFDLDVQFGFLKNNKITLYNKKIDYTVEIVLNRNGKLFSITPIKKKSFLSPNEKIVSTFYDAKRNCFVGVSSYGEIYVHQKSTWHKIEKNTNVRLKECNDILIDLNGDYWITSGINGLYKLSSEPFTPIKLSPLFTRNNIGFNYRTKSGKIVLSTTDGETFITTNQTPLGDLKFPFRIYSAAEYKGQIYLGTNEGVKIYNPTNDHIEKLIIPGVLDQKISLVYHDNISLWFGIAGKGIINYFPESGKSYLSKAVMSHVPTHFYTAQKSVDNKSILFGTNKGIFLYKRSSKSFKRVPFKNKNLGHFSGLSDIDIHGTRWFTLEKGVVGFTVNEEIIELTDESFFVSTIFNTLNSDQFGNLIIGTNKGITILHLDESGHVRDYHHYTGESGFSGYETHLQSQFRDNNIIYLGTIEGLYSINTSLLQNFPKPTKPFVLFERKIEDEKLEFLFSFRVNNPKIENIKYTFRLVGLSDEWSDLTQMQSVSFSDLDNGVYTFEIKATHNGNLYSSISSQTFRVRLPFWKSKWFIAFLIIIFALINVFVFNRLKTFERKSLHISKDTNITARTTPILLMFGVITNTLVQLIAPLIDSSIPNNYELTILIGTCLILLYFLSLKALKTGNLSVQRYYLVIGYCLVMGHNVMNVYLSNLHPYFALGIVLVSMLTPFVFEKIKSIIFYSISLLTLSGLSILYLQDPLYDKFLFLIAVILSIVISIFTTYLRFDSLEKLLFISGIINKGTIPAIAFDKSGEINYVSENISSFIDITHDELLHKKISFLNQFVIPDGEYMNVDLTKQFVNGGKYIVPMRTATKVNWVEWSCKVFAENTYVILGQDITEKMNMQNTYELLVKHANDLIYQCNSKGEFVFLNPSSLRYLEYAERELIGANSIQTVVPIEYRAQVTEFYTKHFRERRSSSYFEFPILNKSGRIIWIGQNVTTVLEPGSSTKVMGFLALARDITEKRANLQLIQQQQEDITASINYAKRIQINLLPIQEDFNRNFSESFVLFRPKAIVSGDFFWMDRLQDHTILVMADCTGHGVPGSFMTLLGINLLNTIVLEDGDRDPGHILNELDEKLIYVLPRGIGDNKVSDGMEATVCVFNHKTNVMSYSCAGSRFLVYKENSFNLYKGDIKHIGDLKEDGFTGFKTNKISLDPNDTLYLFSDGYQDQFGGRRNKKFSFRWLLDILEANIKLPLSDQKGIIEGEFDKWKGNFEQTDDVTIIGLRGIIPNKITSYDDAQE